MYKVYLAYVHIEHVVVSFAGRVLSFRATWSRRESFINVNDTRTPLLDIHTKKGRRGLPPFIYAVSNAVREIGRARNIHVAKKNLD